MNILESVPEAPTEADMKGWRIVEGRQGEISEDNINSLHNLNMYIVQFKQKIRNKNHTKG